MGFMTRAQSTQLSTIFMRLKGTRMGTIMPMTASVETAVYSGVTTMLQTMQRAREMTPPLYTLGF